MNRADWEQEAQDGREQRKVDDFTRALRDEMVHALKECAGILDCICEDLEETCPRCLAKDAIAKAEGKS